MFVVWGVRSILLVIGKGVFLCPKCGVEREFWHKRWKRFFTVYFIPIIPLGNGNEFVECRICEGKYRTEILKAGVGAKTYEARHPIERALTVIAVVIMLLVGILAIQQFVNTQRIAQNAAQAAAKATQMAITFGANNLSRCNNLMQVGDGNLTNTSRIVVIDATTSQVSDDYQAAVPNVNRATSNSDLTDVVCIRNKEIVYAEDSYGEKDSQITAYRCTRYIEQVEAFVIDVRTGQPVAYQRYNGSLPPVCPEQTDTDLSEFGNMPSTATVITGLFSTLPGQDQT